MFISKKTILFLFAAVYNFNFCLAQNTETVSKDNSTFSLAAQLAEIENKIEKGDKSAIYALREPEFAAIKALLDNTTRWQLWNQNNAITQTLLNKFSEKQQDYKPKEANLSGINTKNVTIDAQTAEVGAVSTVSNAINSFGIPSQSQLILGTAAFLAERFKTEITLNYLQKMQATIDESELKYLFPQTRNLLNFQQLGNQQQNRRIGTNCF
jgi:hypothetical protein